MMIFLHHDKVIMVRDSHDDHDEFTVIITGNNVELSVMKAG